MLVHGVSYFYNITSVLVTLEIIDWCFCKWRFTSDLTSVAQSHAVGLPRIILRERGNGEPLYY